MGSLKSEQERTGKDPVKTTNCVWCGKKIKGRARGKSLGMLKKCSCRECIRKMEADCHG